MSSADDVFHFNSQRLPENVAEVFNSPQASPRGYPQASPSFPLAPFTPLERKKLQPVSISKRRKEALNASQGVSQSLPENEKGSLAAEASHASNGGPQSRPASQNYTASLDENKDGTIPISGEMQVQYSASHMFTFGASEESPNSQQNYATQTSHGQHIATAQSAPSNRSFSFRSPSAQLQLRPQQPLSSSQNFENAEQTQIDLTKSSSPRISTQYLDENADASKVSPPAEILNRPKKVPISLKKRKHELQMEQAKETIARVALMYPELMSDDGEEDEVDESDGGVVVDEEVVVDEDEEVVDEEDEIEKVEAEEVVMVVEEEELDGS